VATILIISSIVKRLLWRASPLARGTRFYSGGPGPPEPLPHWRRRCSRTLRVPRVQSTAGQRSSP